MSSTKRFRWLGIVLVAASVSARTETPGRCGSAADDIVGTWRGSSVCTDRAAAPACSDEQVVYEIVATSGKPNTVTVNADRVVDGKRVPMGALDFTLDADGRGWTTEISTPRVHAITHLAVSGTRMQGSMTLLPSKAVVRKMELQKER